MQGAEYPAFPCTPSHNAIVTTPIFSKPLSLFPVSPISQVSLLVPAPFQEQLLQESNPKPTESDISGRAGVSVICTYEVKQNGNKDSLHYRGARTNARSSGPRLRSRPVCHLGLPARFGQGLGPRGFYWDAGGARLEDIR